MNVFRKLRGLDYVILLMLLGIIAYFIFFAETGFHYRFRWQRIPEYIFHYRSDLGEWRANMLLEGLLTTLRLSLYASVLAMLFGVIVGIMRCSENLTLRWLAATYTEFLRNIPPIVTIFVFFFFFSEGFMRAFGLDAWFRSLGENDNHVVLNFFFGDTRRLSSFFMGTLILALMESAFVSEIIRSGIQSIPRGQLEAARSIGMNRFQEMIYILLPQAMRKTLPPLANQFIMLVKDSAIVSLISVQDLTYKTVELIVSTRLVFEAWLTTAAMYFVICFSLSLLFRKLERRRSAQLRRAVGR